MKGWKAVDFCHSLEGLNIIITLCSSETLAAKEELRDPFVPSHSCCVRKGSLAVLGNSSGKCPEEPEGKAQLVCWRAPHTGTERTLVCWTGLIRLQIYAGGNKHEHHTPSTSHQVLCDCVTHLFDFCKVSWCPCTPHPAVPLTPSKRHRSPWCSRRSWCSLYISEQTIPSEISMIPWQQFSDLI